MKLKFLSLIVFAVFSISTLAPSFGMTGDPVKKDTKVEQATTEQDKVAANNNEKQASDASDTEGKMEVKKEKEGTTLSSFSFNYIFYVIYKFKYADIFNFSSKPRSSDQLSIAGSAQKIHQLIKQLY